MTEPFDDNPWATPLPGPRKAKVPTVLLSIAVLCGVIALPLAIAGLRADQAINRDREEDRIEADLDTCERENTSRENQRASALALRTYVDDVLAGVADYAQMSESEEAVLGQILQPARDAIADAIDAIESIDCSAVVPGAEEDQ